MQIRHANCCLFGDKKIALFFISRYNLEINPRQFSKPCLSQQEESCLPDSPKNNKR